jgi:hypothetical protein
MGYITATTTEMDFCKTSVRVLRSLLLVLDFLHNINRCKNPAAPPPTIIISKIDSFLVVFYVKQNL